MTRASPRTAIARFDPRLVGIAGLSFLPLAILLAIAPAADFWVFIAVAGAGVALVSAVLAPDLLLVETLLVFLAARSPLAEPLNLILVRWFLLSLFSVSLMIRWLHYRQKPRAVPIWVMLAGFATLALLSTAYSVEPALTFAKAGSF